MSRTYQSIIDKAELVLQDESTDSSERRWTESELLGWAKEAEEQIAIIKPDSYPVIEAVQLSSGSQQSIPSDAHMLLDVLCNMGTDGTTRGNVVTIVEKKYMNAVLPNWMSATASTTVLNVVYDSKRNPRKYWVYPKSPGTNYLELMSAKLPANSSKVIGDNILLSDEYDTAIKHYILAMAYMKDADIPESMNLHQMHLNTFLQLLGRKEVVEEQVGPKKHRGSN